MFESSLIASAESFSPRRRGPALAAIGLQLTAAAIVLLLPLLYPELLPRSIAAPTLTLPRPQPPIPPPPVPKIHIAATSAQSIAAPAAASAQPSTISRTASLIVREPSESAPSFGPIDFTGSSAGSGPPGALTAGLGSGGTGPKISVTPSAAPGKPSPVHISNGVSAGMLLAPIQPIYPSIAKATHTEGIVVIQAVISRVGIVERAHAVSGPAMLQGAALEAVTRARYRPYLLNGEPTEVETTFTVNFRMQ